MTWNPCGCVVDWSRRPFDCDAQPFADSSQVVRVRFYPAAPGAKAIPFPSNIYVPDWDFDKEWWQPPGVKPAEWPGNPYNRAKSVPGSGNGHVCGTEEQFAGEAELDPDADMQYRADGLPVCCDPREELSGGAGGAPQDGVSVSGVVDLTGVPCAAAGGLVLGTTYRHDWTNPETVVDYVYPGLADGVTTYYLHLTEITTIPGFGAELGPAGGCGVNVMFGPVYDAVGTYPKVVAPFGGFNDIAIKIQANAATHVVWRLDTSP